MRYGMVIELGKCVGCHTCTVACKVEHFTPPGVYWNFVIDQEVGEYPSVRRIFLPTLCNHCKEPACCDACPTGATYKREDGIVAMNYDVCIGCRTCMMACPYQARYFWGRPKDTMYFPGVAHPYEQSGLEEYQRGTVQKCDFCLKRLESGLEPACVKACPGKARTFGDLDDPQSEVTKLIRARGGRQLNAELGTEPSVYYID